MFKSVAVILLNWNTPEHTLNCIASLLQYCNEQLYDIILADNGSTDNSLSLLQERYPDLIYLDNKINLGFAEGNNKALEYSIAHNYQYSLILNTDTLVDEDIVTKLSTHLDNFIEAAAVQPAIYWMNNKSQIWNGEGRFDKFLGKTISNTKQAKYNNYSFKVADWLTGCCMCIRNSALANCGLFNKLFFLYFEDVDLSFRLRNCGYQLHYLPSCKMYHEAGVSAKAAPKKKEGTLNPIIHYYIARNHLWILRLYGKPIYYPINFIYNSFYYISLLNYLLLRGRSEKAKLLIKGLKEGLFTSKILISSGKAHK